MLSKRGINKIKIGNSFIEANDSIIKHLEFILNQNVTMEIEETTHTIRINDLPGTEIIFSKTLSSVFNKTEIEITIINNLEVSSYRHLIAKEEYIESDLSRIVDQLYIKNLTNEDIQMLDIISCKNRTCPICNSKIKDKKSIGKIQLLKCPNKCYKVVFDIYNPTYGNFEFFKDKSKGIFVNQSHPIENRLSNLKKVYETINYYKENDRYLIEILNKED